ncbi:hypothetical protein Kpol_513p13 [Vanderwaltozyma polyspora DSM 70294]|uniref:Elongator complex protein 5 n=1 Tax=Vanderwaltozyma polyspora (strain ATCC 22028 / DSM 70294 / BCRC 21397 / CBS 2163 / NBRC 10782 / NRRL Y-8283 / UCD 57-17) TaxID=436907 RepID=A7TMJ9_VANPO|nr:uncharacterized protein Kpol_513p13 [Vanderwaltozyma polyspora DSM 70294]EDO16497.1 hypothetical protein Kpol_513p13 [Vanderwaltozyma polyspora DSM 70294]
MASSSYNPSILLKRIFSLNETSPLILSLDTIAQTSKNLLNEFVYCSSTNKDITIVYISFETINRPSYATNFIDASSLKLQDLISTLRTYLPSPQEKVAGKFLVIIDSINYISNTNLSQFISSIASPNITFLVNFHKDMPELNDNENGIHYPSSFELLHFMAATILEVEPQFSDTVEEEDVRSNLSKFIIPKGMNNSTYMLTLTNKRKSGRSINYQFTINSDTHEYEIFKDMNEIEDNVNNENPEALQDLATFNLSTSAKQKKAKDQVELPFLEAQSFNTGGAIVYEFEKDDDYDEEDPYEDPF